MSTTDCKGF